MAHTAPRPARHVVKLLVALTVALAVLIPATAAHADWHLSKAGAQRIAKRYVSQHYADTLAQNLTTYCRPQGRRYDRRYVYHRWVCGWYDASDNTSGAVLIVGSDIGGSYYGRVLSGARAAS
jgi:hypothetical protein